MFSFLRFYGRPHIAVTGPDRGGFPAWLFTWLQILLAGGKAVRVCPSNSSIKKINKCQALILGGGADVDPKLYKQQRSPMIPPEASKNSLFSKLIYIFIVFLRRLMSYEPSRNKIDQARDELEINLIKEFTKKNKPIFGICRGMQLLNVVFGGTLHSDISSLYVENPQTRTVWPSRKVEIQSRSLLCTVLKARYIFTNALHDQAIDQLGKDLEVVAREKDGIIQAIESKDPYKRIIGVQWHPEFMPQSKMQRKLFKWLVNEAKSSIYHREKGSYLVTQS